MRAHVDDTVHAEWDTPGHMCPVHDFDEHAARHFSQHSEQRTDIEGVESARVHQRNFHTMPVDELGKGLGIAAQRHVRYHALPLHRLERRPPAER